MRLLDRLLAKLIEVRESIDDALVVAGLAQAGEPGQARAHATCRVPVRESIDGLPEASPRRPRASMDGARPAGGSVPRWHRVMCRQGEGS